MGGRDNVTRFRWYSRSAWCNDRSIAGAQRHVARTGKMESRSLTVSTYFTNEVFELFLVTHVTTSDAWAAELFTERWTCSGTGGEKLRTIAARRPATFMPSIF